MLPGAVTPASFTSLDGACQFFPATLFNDNKFPAFIENLFDSCRNIDHLTSRYNLIISVDITIKHLFIPKAVLGLSIFIDIRNVVSVEDLAFSPERCEWASVGMH